MNKQTNFKQPKKTTLKKNKMELKQSSDKGVTSHDVSYMEAFWMNLTNKKPDKFTLKDAIKYVMEFFNHYYGDNITIINICQKLIGEKVMEFSTSPSVKEVLKDMQPLLLHFKEESTTTNACIDHILQYVELCEEEIDDCDELGACCLGTVQIKSEQHFRI